MLKSIVRMPLQASSDPAPKLVLLHGYGSDENDLMGLASYLDPRLEIESIRAPKSLDWGGFSWFDIQWMENGVKIYGDDAKDSLGELIAHLEADAARPRILSGFSQGAMMSLGVLAERPDLVQGVVAMSGAWLPDWNPKPAEAIPILITHGVNDPVVEIERGREAFRRLNELGYSPEMKEFSMAHEINGPCLSVVSQWVQNWVDSH